MMQAARLDQCGKKKAPKYYKLEQNMSHPEFFGKTFKNETSLFIL
jgi:hypothetical protein